MTHTPTGTGRPRTRAACIVLAMASACAAPTVASANTLSATGSCHAGISTFSVNIATGDSSGGGMDSPCATTWTSSPAGTETSGAATATSSLGGAHADYSAAAAYGNLSVSAYSVSRTNFGNQYVWTTGQASGEATATASFSDTLMLDPSSPLTGALQIVLSGSSILGGYERYDAGLYTLGSNGTSAKLDVLLNGNAVFSTSAQGNYMTTNGTVAEFSHALWMQTGDTLRVMGTITADSPTSIFGPSWPDSGMLLSTVSLFTHLDVSGRGAQLVSASGHDYSSPISAVPEPSTWVLLAAGLLVLGAMNLGRQKLAHHRIAA